MEGSPCVSPLCSAGICDFSFAPVGQPCAEGGQCDQNGTCVLGGGGCTTPADCPPAACNTATCSGGACSYQPVSAGTPCDGGVCAAAGQCQAIQCTTPAECPAASECHTPACDNGLCVELVASGQSCVWEGVIAGSCSVTGACEACKDSPCEQIDMQEPNDTQATAFDLGTTSDCTFFGFCGALTAADVDWYTYVGTDDFACNVSPTAEFTSSEIRVCMYYNCLYTPTSSSCPSGTSPDTAPGGQPGCCGTQPWDYDPCNGNIGEDEDAQVWVKVERSGAGDACLPYALGLEF